MTLAAGTRIGPYEIQSLLGEGGMGEVWRVRDTRLQRDVAIKVLPAAVYMDSERRARFEREARTLASLNHPHIAQIYGVEELGGAPGLVMELVEGPTLAERIARGPIAPDEALPIALQIADALDNAHERGIVHRDLKPANIKLRHDGTVKILDFGLAKAAGPADIDPLTSPTLTSPALTERGLILGTAAYMSPEQARGRSVDKRADIWAFGVVLFEMLTGRQLFAGETVSDTLAAVLRQDIPWDQLPASIPSGIVRLLRQCLVRDPKDRLHDVADARLDIEAAMRAPETAAAQTVPALQHRWLSRAGWVVAGIAIIAAAALWLTRVPTTNERPWQQFTRVTDAEGEESAPSLSTDGDYVAYASRARGSWDIYVQRVGGRNASLIAGDPARQESAPAFSPDGKRIAYHDAVGRGGIFIVGASGEANIRLTDFGFHPAWSPDGRQIAFSTEEVRNPSSTYNVARLWVLDVASRATREIQIGEVQQPAWSPSGARIAYWTVEGGQRDLFTVPASGGPRVPVLRDAPLDWCPTWSTDGRFLYFASDRGGTMNLWRIAIDEASGRARGAPEPVTAGVESYLELPTFSRDGRRLAFRSRTVSTNPVAVPFDPASTRAGVPVVLTSQNATLIPTDVSPDGRRLLLMNLGDQQEDLFIANSDGSGLSRLTDDAARDRMPGWTSDGQKIVFYSNRGGKWEIWEMDPDGGGMRNVARHQDDLIWPMLSRSDDRLTFIGLPKAGGGEIYTGRLPRAGSNAAPQWRLLPGLMTEERACVVSSWSFDGRRLAGLLATAVGKYRGVGVYDIASATLREVSRDVTPIVRWLPDGRVVYFTEDTPELVVVDPDSGRRVVVPVKLSLPASRDGFAVSRDGRTIYYGGVKAEADIWVVERGAATTSPK